MRIKNMFYYYLYDHRYALVVFYTVIVAIYMMFGIMSISYGDNGKISGMEVASIIFIFIVGLNSFKSDFYFGLANGVSRKTQFISFLAAAGMLGISMALVDTVIGRIMGSMFTNDVLYLQLYAGRYDGLFAELALPGKLQVLFEGFLWHAVLYCVVAMLGYCITLLYYRSSTIMKYVISVIPVIVFFLLVPYIDQMLNGRLVGFISEAFKRMMGFGITINPYIAVLSFLACFGILSGLSYLLIRRAVIKQQ